MIISFLQEGGRGGLHNALTRAIKENLERGSGSAIKQPALK